MSSHPGRIIHTSVVDLERLQASLAGSFAYDIGRSVVVGRAADERFRAGPARGR